MQLSLLREHYYSKDKAVWLPKKAFDSEQEARDTLGVNLHIYSCSLCNKYHTASHPIKDRNKAR